ncbi:MAG: hypothetical protein FWC71_10010 [Defluviitaleaceae bacterium]|nr:hypothetical protein [Defluviitaleaceae bacterium]
MAKKKNKYGQYAATCVVAAAVGLGVYAFLSDFELGDLSLPFVSGESGDASNDSNNITPPEDDPIENQAQPSGQDDETDAQVGLGDIPLVIEVYNDRIIFNGNDITFYELEDILLAHGNDTDVWELVDVHQAAVTVYNAVIEAFQRHNVMLAER